MMVKEMAISKFKEIYFPVGTDDEETVKTVSIELNMSFFCSKVMQQQNSFDRFHT